MNRVNTQALRLIELYCEIELRDGDDEPKVTKVFPKENPDGENIIKILPQFAYPYKSKVEK